MTIVLMALARTLVLLLVSSACFRLSAQEMNLLENGGFAVDLAAWTPVSSGNGYFSWSDTDLAGQSRSGSARLATVGRGLSSLVQCVSKAPPAQLLTATVLFRFLSPTRVFLSVVTYPLPFCHGPELLSLSDSAYPTDPENNRTRLQVSNLLSLPPAASIAVTIGSISTYSENGAVLSANALLDEVHLGVPLTPVELIHFSAE